MTHQYMLLSDSIPTLMRKHASVALLCLAGTAAPLAAQEAEGEVRNVVLGMLPISTLIPAYFAQENGWFAEEGLSVEFKPEIGGVDVITSVIAGDFDFGYSNQTSLMVAYARGLPVRAIANGFMGEDHDETGNNAIVVQADSDIQSLADLRGRTVTTNTLNNFVHLAFLEALANAGIEDPMSEVTFVEVSFPDVASVVASGQVDAGWVVEPFVQTSLAIGLRELAYPVYEAAPEGTIFSAYFTSREMIEENPDLVDGFVRAIYRGQQYANENPDEVRAAFPRFNQNVSEELANAFYLPVWEPELTPEHFRRGAELAVKYGFLDEVPDLEDLVYQPAE